MFAHRKRPQAPIWAYLDPSPTPKSPIFKGFCAHLTIRHRHQIPLQSFQQIKSPQAGEASARHHGGAGVCGAVAWRRFDFGMVGGVIGADVDSVQCGANGELVRWVRKSPPMWWAALSRVVGSWRMRSVPS